MTMNTTAATNTPMDAASLHALALTLQEQFDTAAEAYSRSGDEQARQRITMLALLSGIERRTRDLSALVVEAEPGDAARIHELKEANLDALTQFDRATVAYVDELHTNRSRLFALRDTLAAFNAAEQRLREVGGAAPRPLRSVRMAAALQPAVTALRSSAGAS